MGDRSATPEAIDPERDLTLRRTLLAPPSVVWRAWTDPERLTRWWIPAPMTLRVERLEVRPGGGLVTSMSEDGRTFVPHVDALILVVEPDRRLVFSNALDSAGRPASPAPVAMTAEITLATHDLGTDYGVLVRHGDPAARARHEELGFADGWGAVTDQLAALVEGEATARSV